MSLTAHFFVVFFILRQPPRVSYQTLLFGKNKAFQSSILILFYNISNQTTPLQSPLHDVLFYRIHFSKRGGLKFLLANCNFLCTQPKFMHRTIKGFHKTLKQCSILTKKNPHRCISRDDSARGFIMFITLFKLI